MVEDNYSKYLLDKYKINISDELGEIIENLVVKTSISNETIEYDGLWQLQEYLVKHNSVETIRVVVLLKESEVKEYFVCRWILHQIDNALISDEYELFTNLIKEYCEQVFITDSLIDLLQKCIEANEKRRYKYFLQRYFNFMVERGKFLEYRDEQMVFMFIGVWKIVKLCFYEESPVYKTNMESFCNLLKLISKINKEKSIVNLGALDLSYMDFSKENMDETCFYNVNFNHSNFKEASLDSICWSGSNISVCDFLAAFMECAHLEDCNCRNTFFKKTHLLSAVVSGADFSGASLENCNFMECDADRIQVKGLKIDDKTAFNDTDFRYVDWKDVDISGVSISANQINNFWELVNCTRNTILYDAKFKKLENDQIQEVIYEELMKSKNSFLKNAKLSVNVPDVFISYASEELQSFAHPLYHAIVESEKVRKTVWLDENHLELGGKLRTTIESVISYCKATIVIYSDAYERKGWTKYEWNRVLDEYEKRRMPIVVLDMSTTGKLCKEIGMLYDQSNMWYIKYDEAYTSKVLECLGKS